MLELQNLLPLIEGFCTGLSLILPIGAQNALVLRQGVKKHYVLLTALLCVFIDMTLIALGVAGLGTIIASNATLMTLATWGGALFLFYYGFRSFREAFSQVPHTTEEIKLYKPTARTIVMTVLAISLLNPHVYLDTVVLIGSISTQFSGTGRLFFALGAMGASAVWFPSLAYGATFLEPFFRKPIAWKCLDILTGLIMWSVAVSLLWPTLKAWSS